MSAMSQEDAILAKVPFRLDDAKRYARHCPPRPGQLFNDGSLLLLGEFGRCHRRPLSHIEVSLIKCQEGASDDHPWILRTLEPVRQLEVTVERARQIRQFDGDGRPRGPWVNAPDLPWRCLQCAPCVKNGKAALSSTRLDALVERGAFACECGGVHTHPAGGKTGHTELCPATQLRKLRLASPGMASRSTTQPRSTPASVVGTEGPI